MKNNGIVADKLTNFEAVRIKLIDSSDEASVLKLTPTQEKLYDRWSYAIDLRLCERMNTGEIILKLMEKFEIERRQAYNDLENAEEAFGYNVRLNKQIRMKARIDYLEEKIAKLDEAKEYEAAAILEKTLQQYYKDFPQEAKKKTAKNLYFIFNGGDSQLMDGIPTVDQAVELLSSKTNG